MKKKKILLLAFSFIFCLGAVYPFYKKSKIYDFQADVAIWGPIVMADGIGRQTVELAEALRKKHKVQILSNHVEKTDIPLETRKILKTKYKKPPKVIIVEESLWGPGDPLNRFFSETDSKDQIRFAYTMLESTKIIPEWVMMINLYFDAIIVPDPFLVDAYQSSGVTVPIFHIPLGIDIGNFLEAPLKQAKTNGPFVFACLGTGIERKNHKMAIQAFAKAFGNNENVHLHINCRTAVPEIRNSIIEEIKKQNCSNIKYTEVRLRKDAYLKFFSSIDCLLSFSKGEGFSIQPREAMALGIPVIVTDNTAQSTICKTGLVKSVLSPIAEPRYYYDRNLSDGEHFNCHFDDAVAAIQDVYENYDNYLSNGPEMRAWASAYDYKNLTPLYESLVAPKNIILGKTNEVSTDSLTTNSPQLYEKYKKIFNLP